MGDLDDLIDFYLARLTETEKGLDQTDGSEELRRENVRHQRELVISIRNTGEPLLIAHLGVMASMYRDHPDYRLGWMP